MGILDNLAGMFGGGRAGAQTTGRAGHGGLGDIINSGALGPLAKSVLTDRNGDFSWIKGAMLAGAGSMLWKKLSERVAQENAAKPQYGQVQATPKEQAIRIIRALVYAAKSDGHIDEQEKQAINARIRTLNIGAEGEALVRQAMNEPLDPSLIADGVKDPQEALQLYTLSSAVITSDQFMEKTYLDALAQALGIPSDVKTQVDDQVGAGRLAPH